MKWTDCYGCSHDPKVIRKKELATYIDSVKKEITELREKRDKKSNKFSRQEIIDEINKKVEDLKPYIEERSKLTKTISKNPMCDERYFRFLKEPKGVIPTMLQNLLDARKNTRVGIKDNKKQIEKLLENGDKNKVNELVMLNNVLDKRQLAYKICANSVAATTPIPCKIDGKFIYKTIEEISKGDWERINEEQEVSTPIDNIEVWSDKGFTKPKFVMRHPKSENLFRVNTHTGCVDCTGDHSLLRKNGEEVKPKNLKLGDELMHEDFPLPSDTPNKPLFLSLSDESINNYSLHGNEEEIAFVHGVFFAEGSCGTWGVLGKAKTTWVIYNQDLRLLERCKNILNKIEDETFKISKYYDSARTYHLVPTISIINISKKYRDMFYDKRKYKKFPDYIFNSPLNIRQAFFMGYYNGDGNRNLEKGIVINNKGNRGCASLFYLAKSLGYKVSISYSKDGDSDFTYRLQCCTDFRIKKEHSIKQIEIITQVEEEYNDTITEKIVRNDELIEFNEGKSFYRNIIINCERFPRQKLLDSLDDAIICANRKFSYVIEYFTKGKYICCKKYCCGREYKIKLQTLKNRNSNMHNSCNCGITPFEFECKNKKNIYSEKDYIEYVYDIETENHHFAAGVGNMIVHNSMYGSWGVRKGYLPFMPGAMCLLGDSLISYSFGFTRKMKDLVKTDSLWSYNNGQVVSNGKGLIYKGKRELVRITLIDGRILKCTPEHKIMTKSGWIEAGKLLPKHNWNGKVFNTNSEYSKVIVGLELPEDIIGEDEKNWKLLNYTMDTFENREKTLAFCRVLGFILSDGSISQYLGGKTKDKELSSCKVSIGTLIDSKLFVSDIKILTGQEPTISDILRSDIKGNVFAIHVPKILVDEILLIEGVLVGKRTHQPFTLPDFIFEPDCPLSVAREFLGGLFGGDGTSPSLSVSHPSFSPVEFGISTIEKYKDDMFVIMNKLITLFDRFDMKFWLREPRLARERKDLLPKDIKENPRWEYYITTNSCFSLLFAQKIGFRYCSDKNNKLTVAASYQRYSDNVRKQHINIVLKTSEMYDLHDKHYKIKYILEKARKEIYENEIPLHEYFSLSKCTDVHNYRARPHTLEGFKLLKKYFPTAREYAQMAGCDHWFSEKQKSKKIYSIERDQKSNPCLYLDVVDVRYDGIDDVYDIIDVPNQSFVANGIVVHNCTTFMGRTNIEVVAKTIVEKYKGELVYGDTDSNYIHFPHLKNKTAAEAWDYAVDTAEKISSLFPRPIKLDFEEAAYEVFFILTKKRYMYKACGKDGIISDKIGKRGVLLNRRDSSIFIRNLYEKIVMKIMDKENRDEILYFILQELNRLCSNSVPYKDFVVTKSVGNAGNLMDADDNCKIEGDSVLETYIDEKGKEKIKLGDYIAPKLPKDQKEREKQFKLKDARTIKEYYERCLPAQVQLAEKMRRRGQIVQTGSRLEFLVTDIENHTAKQYEKLESMEYFLENSSFLTVDFFYYIKIAINSIDEILNIAFSKNDRNYPKPFKKDFIKEQYIFRYKKRRAVIEQIKNLFKPKISIG